MRNLSAAVSFALLLPLASPARTGELIDGRSVDSVWKLGAEAILNPALAPAPLWQGDADAWRADTVTVLERADRKSVELRIRWTVGRMPDDGSLPMVPDNAAYLVTADIGLEDRRVTIYVAIVERDATLSALPLGYREPDGRFTQSAIAGADALKLLGFAGFYSHTVIVPQ